MGQRSPLGSQRPQTLGYEITGLTGDVLVESSVAGK